jgi:uncharacterized protein (TIGR02145 family)
MMNNKNKVKNNIFTFNTIIKGSVMACLLTINTWAQADLALGKTGAVTASSTEGAHVPGNAVDGNGTSRWSSNYSDPQWLQIDLGATYSITRVILTWEVASARDYRVEVSADGNTPWTPLTTQSNKTVGARKDDLQNLTGSGRYIRMYGTARTSNYGYSLYSFEVYGSGGSMYTLSIVNPTGAGTMTLTPPGGSYTAGTMVTLEANASSGYQFSGWSGAINETSNPTAITMNGNYSVTVNFIPYSNGYQTGDLSYFDGSNWARIPKGTVSQVLTESETQTPQWNSQTIVTDIDGNVYTTVKIGTQVWMKQNLKTTRYTDGTPIPNITSSAQWAALTIPGYCWYNFDNLNKEYGALYNWHVIDPTNPHKIAPPGWHVPSNNDWNILINYTGGSSIAEKKLKEAGLQHWGIAGDNYYYNSSNNESGFSALPGGGIYYDGSFGRIHVWCSFWSTTFNPNTPWDASHFFMECSNAGNPNEYIRSWDDRKEDGFSVRLVKD